jgi:hypothetical protein
LSRAERLATTGVVRRVYETSSHLMGIQSCTARYDR